jgi:hypothetical protein
MNDPHVLKLFYSISSGKSVDLSQATQATCSVLGGRFVVTLDGDEMLAEPQGHYASAEEARAELDPYLRSWEIQAGLAVSTPSIQFDYRRAEVIDRDPKAGVISAPLVINANLFARASVRADVCLAKFPAPPSTEQCNEATERMYRRLMDIWADDKYMTTGSYYILTEAEERFVNRKAAADALRVDVQVLNKIGELTSRAGGEGARKAEGAGTPLTNKQVTWLKGAVRALVLRNLEYDGQSADALEVIRMAHLPSL